MSARYLFKTLAAPGLRRRNLRPLTSMEQRLQALWTLVLSVPELGSDDNFLRLGGDSMSAIRLVAAARDHGMSLTVYKIFKNPVLPDMALVVSVVGEEDEPEVPPFALLGDLDTSSLIDIAALQCNIEKHQIEDMSEPKWVW
ncbi:unnamed protein product [Sphagnum balticum]